MFFSLFSTLFTQLLSLKGVVRKNRHEKCSKRRLFVDETELFFRLTRFPGGNNRASS
jgi:hypothetical protein